MSSFSVKKLDYVLGVYTKKNIAIKRAEEEKYYRGGNKYYPEVLEFNHNKDIRKENCAVILGDIE